MGESAFLRRRKAWEDASSAEAPEDWISFLEEFDEGDLFPFVGDVGELVDFDTVARPAIPVARWLTHMFRLGKRRRNEVVHDDAIPIRQRLAVATFVAWETKAKRRLLEARETLSLPPRGAFVYYGDLLQSAMLCTYEFVGVGGTVEMVGGLAIPRPHAFLDPVQALSYTQDRAHVDVVKRTLGSPARLVMHRNVMVSVDRDRHYGVFGPTIDTLFLSEWLFANRYVRTSTNPLRKVLEVGCGNGLLLSGIAKNCRNLELIDGVDIDPVAIACTAQNIRAQGVAQSVEAYLSVGSFAGHRYQLRYDLIVSNPPYIPEPSFGADSRTSAHVATHGTELIDDLMASVSDLLADDGEYLMVSSLLADEEIFEAASRNGLSTEMLQSRKVPFDIGHISESHRAWLSRERGLEQLEPHEWQHEIGIYRTVRGGERP